MECLRAGIVFAENLSKSHRQAAIRAAYELRKFGLQLEDTTSHVLGPLTWNKKPVIANRFQILPLARSFDDIVINPNLLTSRHPAEPDYPGILITPSRLVSVPSHKVYDRAIHNYQEVPLQTALTYVAYDVHTGKPNGAILSTSFQSNQTLETLIYTALLRISLDFALRRINPDPCTSNFCVGNDNYLLELVFGGKFGENATTNLCDSCSSLLRESRDSTSNAGLVYGS